jgi:hypothetical protein
MKYISVITSNIHLTNLLSDLWQIKDKKNTNFL